MPWHQDRPDLHDTVVLRLARLLKAKYPDSDIVPNVKWKRSRQGPPLTSGIGYYPDISDYTRKIAYEVHWKGSRKETSFASLPEGWRGVNVFIDDYLNPFTVLVRMPEFNVTFIDGYNPDVPSNQDLQADS